MYALLIKQLERERLFMDASNITMTVTHLCIAWTLFGALLVWIFLFAFLALKPVAKKDVETVEASYSTTLTSTAPPAMAQMSIAQSPVPSSVHMYETANEVIHSA